MEFFPLTLGTTRQPPAFGAREGKGPARSYEAWHEQRVGPAEEFDETPAAQVLAELKEAARRPASGCRMMLVLGEPGSGKSALLEHWHATWLAGLPPPRLGLPVPVLVRLREVEAKALAGRPEEVADRVWELRGARDRERTPAGACYDLPPRLLSPVWLLDGLDEFPAPNLATPRVWEALAALPGAVVLSCRTAMLGQIRHDAEGAARRIIDAAHEQRILGLKPAEQEEFLRLALAAEYLDPARAPELVRRLNASAPLRPLAANPLLLHLAALTSAGAEVPANRAAFYAKATHRLWRWMRNKEPDRPLGPAAERDGALASLAAAMGLETIEALEAEALLERAGVPAPLRGDLVRSGLLRHDEARDRLSFPHLTFQEFHLARSLRARPFAEVLAERWTDPRYEEALALLMALHADQGRGAIVSAALRAFVEQVRESHAANPRPLWSLGRSPMRVALHLHGRAAAPGIALPFQLSAEPVLLRLAIAGDERSPPQALSVLSGDPEARVRWEAAANSATPTEALSALLRDPDAEVRTRAALNSATPTELLRALSRDPDAGMRSIAAVNSATPKEALSTLSCDPHAEVRSRAAVNSGTAAEALPALSCDVDVAVRAAAAWNSRMPAKALSALSCDSDAEVRAAAARNSATPPEALVTLSRDRDAAVRTAAAWNSATPPEALVTLSRDQDAWVRTQAAGNSKTPAEALAALWREPDFRVRTHAARNSMMSAEALRKLSGDPYSAVRFEAAGNEATPIDALLALSRDPDAMVRSWAAGNSRMPAETLSALACDLDASVSWAAARNQSALLEDLGHRAVAPTKKRHGRSSNK